MPHFSLKTLPKEQRIQLIAEFYDTIAMLKKRNEVRAFLRDLLSGGEIAMLMRRIETAALLLSGYSDRAIGELTGIGRTKIEAVRKKLAQEHRDGYRLVVRRLLDARKKRIQKARRIEREAGNPWAQMKRKYKTHHLLDHIIDHIIDHQERKGKELTEEALHHTPSRKC